MGDHMDIINTICNEVEFGFGKRLMAIPADLMADAPASLLAITKEVIGRDILNSADIGYVELTKQQAIRKTKTYRVFAFKDSEVEMNHDDALAFALRTHMRLLDKDEAEWFRKNFDKLPMWKKSLDKQKWYWTSSVDSDNRHYAWQFIGSYGYVISSIRFSPYGARCVGGE
jgi:hypothetical protein